MKLRKEQLEEMLALMASYNFTYIWLKEDQPILYFNPVLHNWADAKGYVHPDPTVKR